MGLSFFEKMRLDKGARELKKVYKKLRKRVEKRFNKEHWPTYSFINADLATPRDNIPVAVFDPNKQYCGIKDYFDHNSHYNNLCAYHKLDIMMLRSFTRDATGWPSSEMDSYYILSLENKEALKNLSVPIVIGSKQKFDYKDLRQNFSKIYEEVEKAPMVHRNGIFTYVADSSLALPTATIDNGIKFYYKDGSEFDGDIIDLAIMVNFFNGETLLYTLNKAKDFREQSDKRIKEIKDAFKDEKVEKEKAVENLYESLK